MFFRFSAALLLIVLVSMAGVVLEKRTLELRRSVSRQYFQTDLLLEQHVRLRLETQRLTAPAQLALLKAERSAPWTRDRAVPSGRSRDDRPTPESSPDSGVRLPLLRFQQPFSPESFDR